MRAAPDHLPLFAANAAFVRLAAKVVALSRHIARLSKRLDDLNRELSVAKAAIAALAAGRPDGRRDA